MGGRSDNKLGCKGIKNSSHQVHDLLFFELYVEFLEVSGWYAIGREKLFHSLQKTVN